MNRRDPATFVHAEAACDPEPRGMGPVCTLPMGGAPSAVDRAASAAAPHREGP
jgi:hypothetical protein